VAAAIAADGPVAALAYPGATDGAAFRTFVERVLAPELRPGDVVVLDNLAAHRDAAAARALREAGAEPWFLPPYSPDLNPIEMVFSKFKGALRRMAARTGEALMEAIGRALAAVSAADCANCCRHCGY
jgi:transposase